MSAGKVSREGINVSQSEAMSKNNSTSSGNRIFSPTGYHPRVPVSGCWSPEGVPLLCSRCWSNKEFRSRFVPVVAQASGECWELLQGDKDHIKSFSMYINVQTLNIASPLTFW